MPASLASATFVLRLLAVNSKRIIVGASESKEYVVVLPPTKIQKDVKINFGDENA